jgi:glycosyltransferase involved in cell wall biosynthesis
MEAPRVTSLDFTETSVARPPALVEASLDLWGMAPTEDQHTYLAHFGIVDPIKNPDLLVDTLGLLTDRENLRLVFVGPISEELCAELVMRARGIGVEGRLGFTGPLAPDAYLAWLNRATLALQLRNKNNGEASAAIGECLATGLATVVSEIGWSGELPRDCVHHVRFSVTSRELALEISVLLDDTRLRHAIGDAGAIHAKHHSFDYAARALLALIADRTRARQRTGADA